jgi:hypothetical protein
MQLNESTYETIFLLYIDKELSPKERLEVEAFIADNPRYALEMEALQATVLSSNKIQYPFKENLKQQTEISLEALEEVWDTTYATILKADLETIPGLTTPFKNTLKKATAPEGIVVKSFGFSQQKFTYAAIAACLMVFFGYQQLTKAPVSNTLASNTKMEVVSSTSSPLVKTEIINASPKAFAKNNEQIAETKPLVLKKEQAITKLDIINSSKTQRNHLIQQESIALAEPTQNNSRINQNMIGALTSNYNNPININAAVMATTSIDSETAPEENEPISYEVIDTEDPNRTIFIANFEIDGAAFRGITRRVSALLKRNKSEKEK